MDSCYWFDYVWRKLMGYRKIMEYKDTEREHKLGKRPALRSIRSCKADSRLNSVKLTRAETVESIPQPLFRWPQWNHRLLLSMQKYKENAPSGDGDGKRCMHSRLSRCSRYVNPTALQYGSCSVPSALFAGWPAVRWGPSFGYDRMRANSRDAHGLRRLRLWVASLRPPAKETHSGGGRVFILRRKRRSGSPSRPWLRCFSSLSFHYPICPSHLHYGLASVPFHLEHWLGLHHISPATVIWLSAFLIYLLLFFFFKQILLFFKFSPPSLQFPVFQSVPCPLLIRAVAEGRVSSFHSAVHQLSLSGGGGGGWLWITCHWQFDHIDDSWWGHRLLPRSSYGQKYREHFPAPPTVPSHHSTGRSWTKGAEIKPNQRDKAEPAPLPLAFVPITPTPPSLSLHSHLWRPFISFFFFHSNSISHPPYLSSCQCQLSQNPFLSLPLCTVGRSLARALGSALSLHCDFGYRHKVGT